MLSTTSGLQGSGTMDELPDIQARPSESGFKLTRVGITNLGPYQM